MNGLEPLKWKRGLQNHQLLHQFLVEYKNDSILLYQRPTLIVQKSKIKLKSSRDFVNPTVLIVQRSKSKTGFSFAKAKKLLIAKLLLLFTFWQRLQNWPREREIPFWLIRTLVNILVRAVSTVCPMSEAYSVIRKNEKLTMGTKRYCTTNWQRPLAATGDGGKLYIALCTMH